MAKKPMEGTRAIGHFYEGVAERYLKRKGVNIINRNVYNRGGELDLIGYDEDILVFFEVRFRDSGCLVDPISSVTRLKQRKLVQAAAFYLHKNRLWEHPARIDVIGIMPGTTHQYRVQWVRDAIQMT